MSHSIATAFLLLLLTGSASAQSGTVGQATMPVADPAMCDALASVPNAPMTVETCRAMLQMAQDDPAAHRPGDEAMTCLDIFDELSATTSEMRISDEEVARRQKTLNDLQTLNARHGSKAAAELAPNVAAMQAIGAVAPFVPSAVTAPAVAAQQAQIQAKGKVAGDAYSAEARQLTGDSTAAAVATMGNPRTKRLSQLAVQTDCQAPTQ